MGSAKWADLVDKGLQRALEHRAADEGQACLAALEEAHAASLRANEAGRLAKAAWRLAKGHHDFGHPAGMLDALVPLLDGENPFEHYPAGLQAVGPISQRVWDELGYGRPEVLALWDAWSREYQRRGDPYFAAHGQVQKAWQYACHGDIDELARLNTVYAATRPERFGSGTHKHPRAPDTPHSVFWVQMDLARTMLRAGIWSNNDRYAWDAYEAYEDAFEEAETGRDGEFWFLEPVVQAATRFGWTDPLTKYEEPFRVALQQLEHPRADYHRALAMGQYPLAAKLSDEGGYGAEWTVFAYLEAGELELARHLAECFSLGIFHDRI
jgi:hypothetical protein